MAERPGAELGVLPSGLCGRPGPASQSTKGYEHGVRVFLLGVLAVHLPEQFQLHLRGAAAEAGEFQTLRLPR